MMEEEPEDEAESEGQEEEPTEKTNSRVPESQGPEIATA